MVEACRRLPEAETADIPRSWRLASIARSTPALSEAKVLRAVAASLTESYRVKDKAAVSGPLIAPRLHDGIHRLAEEVQAGLLQLHATELQPNSSPQEPQPETDVPLLPRWDKDRQCLYLGERVIRRIPRRAKNLIAVIEGFELSGWAFRTDSPFEKGSTRLTEAVKQLNETLTGIRFHTDGGGTGVTWE